MKSASELINILIQGMDKVSKTNNRSQMHSMIEKILSELLESEHISFLIWDEKGSRLYSMNEQGEVSIPYVDLKGLIGNSFMTKTAAIYNHVKSEKLFDVESDTPENFRIKAQLLFPLIENDDIVGILRASRSIRVTQVYTQNDLELLRSVEPYLLKMLHIMLDGPKKAVSIDESEINAKLQKVEEKTRNDNADINDTVIFLANTVHDIRTPANSLYGFLELIEEQTDDPKMLSFISNAKESAVFINNLTDSILERIKHENEVRESTPVSVHPIRYFASIGNIFTANMSAKNIDFIINIDPTIPAEISVDAIKLKRVLINLIGNAYKFTPNGKSIEFRIVYDKAANKMKLMVIDSGLGIPKDRQQAIFKAFEQASEDTSIHFGGTGLGLAISLKYVQEMGGILNLESEVEVGSTFTVELPLNAVDSTPAYTPFADINKKIVIYTDNIDSPVAANIKSFFTRLSMPDSNIMISNKIAKDTTHLICFEEMFNEAVIKACAEHNIKLLVVENKLFSLSRKYKELNTIAKNTYCADTLYSTVSSRRKPKMLIVDDSKTNVLLLESMLEGVYCDIAHELNPQYALERLTAALEKGRPYDMVFLDKYMPEMDGSELLKQYREIEAKYPQFKSIYAVSISGDALVDPADEKLFDKFVRKPFKSSAVREIFEKN